jgi:ribosomal protein S18 acetylase RimI-like enzyme
MSSHDGSKVEIRPYADKDYRYVKQILIEGDLYDPVSDTRRNLKRKISMQPDSILVILADGKVIGEIFTMYDGWKALIYRFGLKKEYRGRKLGLNLLRHAEKLLRKKGAEKVQLYSHHYLKKLHSYYKKNGYSRVGTEARMMKKL